MVFKCGFGSLLVICLRRWGLIPGYCCHMFFSTGVGVFGRLSYIYFSLCMSLCRLLHLPCISHLCPQNILDSLRSHTSFLWMGQISVVFSSNLLHLSSIVFMYLRFNSLPEVAGTNITDSFFSLFPLNHSVLLDLLLFARSTFFRQQWPGIRPHFPRRTETQTHT